MADGTRGLVSRIEGYLRAGGYGAKQCMHFGCGRILCSLLTRACTNRAHHNSSRTHLCLPRASWAQSVHDAGQMMA